VNKLHTYFFFYGELFLLSLENHTISYGVITSALNATRKTPQLVLSFQHISRMSK